MEGLGVAVNVVAVVDLSVKVASICLQYAKDVRNAATDIERLHEEVTNLRRISEDVQSLLKSPNGKKLEKSQNLDDALGRSLSRLTELEERLKPSTTNKAMSRVGFRALKWPFKRSEVEPLLQEFWGCTQTISLTLQVDQTGVLLEVDRNIVQIDRKLFSIDQKTVLQQLPVAEGASFDSRAEEHNPTCLRNTRVDILQQISDWSNDPYAKPIFWLNGMAGTGKSTISRTLARSFDSSGYLGASFLFKRGEADRGSLSKFFTTIAAQLAERVPDLAVHIKAAIDADPTIARKAAREQFDRLIMQPLAKIHQESRGLTTLVVVVDALDECELDEDVKLIINLFSHSKTLEFLSLRFFVTSRPELPIRLGFNAIKGTYQDVVLHEIDPQIIKHDISAFMEQELMRIKNEYNSSVSEDRQLSTEWPGERNVDILVKMAIPLFVFAATVCRFLADRKCGNPNKQLKQVLEFQSESQTLQLDATYLPIMHRLIEGLTEKQQGEVIKRFRYIVGSIVTLANPLPLPALGQILDVQKETIDDQLDLLHSVLSIPLSSQSPVRLLHLSFRDFLVNPERREKSAFWIDEKQTHNQLATNCLRVMGKNLQSDICKLIQPGADRTSLSSETISLHIPPEMQYACLYWAQHIQQADVGMENDGPIYNFLLQHFLHWLEVLSLIGRISESLRILKELQVACKLSGGELLVDFIQDAQRFVLANISVIDSTPLQIYSSVLAFTPKNSMVRKAFFQDHQAPKWISLAPEPEDEWDQCQQILEGHVFTLLAFSPDSKLLASTGDETVRLWQVNGGIACIHELKGHTSRVPALAFSPDSKLLASVSDDKTVRLWEVDSGICTCIQELQYYPYSVESAAFSPDFKLLASSASVGEIIGLWQVGGSSTCIQEFKGHTGDISSLVFWSDSKLLASASDKGTIRLWQVDTSTCIQEFKGHADILSVSFSPDLRFVASTSTDKSVRLWQVGGSSICIQELKGHTDWVRSVVFSPDSKLLASSSNDNTIRLWQVGESSTCIQELKGHVDWVRSLAFLPNSKLLASASDDMTIRLWDIKDGIHTYTHELKEHAGWVRSVVFSPDLKVLASVSNNKTVQLWQADRGIWTQELVGHTDWVRSIAFSPNSKLLASASEDKTVRLWEVETGLCIQELKGHTNCIWPVVFSPNSKFLASASKDKTVRIWDAVTGSMHKCTQELKGHERLIQSVVFSPDSKLLASASADHTVRLWEVETGICIHKLMGHTSWVRSAVFSPDSKLLASASNDQTVRLWEVETGMCVHKLEDHTHWVRSVAFSSDSKLLASASSDETVRLWEVSGGACIQKISGISTYHLQFNPKEPCIHTDVGTISLPRCALSNGYRTTPLAQCLSGIGISENMCWVTWQGNRLFWLPTSFRAKCSIVSGSTLVIGCGSGRVIFLTFRDPRL